MAEIEIAADTELNSWAEFKTLILTTKAIPAGQIQYDVLERGGDLDLYEIWATDDQDRYYIRINKKETPVVGTAQEDFEDNYKAGANQRRVLKVDLDIGGNEETDDDAVAGGQDANLNISMNYGWDGVDWERIQSTDGALDVNISNGDAIGTSVEHFDGSATTTPATITFAATSKSIFVENVNSGTNHMLVSFDGGTKWKTVRKDESISLDVSLASLKIKTESSTSDYEILVVE